jgi:hypothetical protein
MGARIRANARVGKFCLFGHVDALIWSHAKASMGLSAKNKNDAMSGEVDQGQQRYRACPRCSVGASAGVNSGSIMSLRFIKPLDPALVEAPPTGEWLHEIKYDGYRMQLVKDAGRVRAYSKTGRDWTV